MDLDQKVALLRETMPFQVVSDALLREIAELAWEQSFPRNMLIYRAGDPVDDLYIVTKGAVRHELGPEAIDKVKVVRAGGVFGWAAILAGQPNRLALAVAEEDTEVLRVNGNALIKLFERDPATGDVVMSRFSTLIAKDFTMPHLKALLPPAESQHLVGMQLTLFRLRQWIKSPRPYLMLLGFAAFLGFWYLAVEVWQLPRFRDMPGLTTVVREWLSPDPTYGLSIYTPEYYQHIWVSVRRVGIAFVLATALGVPLGLFLGWSKAFREYIFPIFEMLRPIPILAWVPLAILMFVGTETPVIYLTFLASFFATALNTMLGVESIDESYTRAAACLGATRWQVFRQVIVPGALPFVFTGLQISVGVAWFSLVAAEMVSGQFGLGYVINTSYTMVRYPTIIIGMVTLGAVGYVTSALVRMVGDHMMQWRVRELALGGQT